MKNNFKILMVALLTGMAFMSFSQQVDQIKLNADKVIKFTPYVSWQHGGAQGFETWKASNKIQYAKEMWYYSESFYIKRNASQEGVTMEIGRAHV